MPNYKGKLKQGIKPSNWGSGNLMPGLIWQLPRFHQSAGH